MPSLLVTLSLLFLATEHPPPQDYQTMHEQLEMNGQQLLAESMLLQDCSQESHPNLLPSNRLKNQNQIQAFGQIAFPEMTSLPPSNFSEPHQDGQEGGQQNSTDNQNQDNANATEADETPTDETPAFESSLGSDRVRTDLILGTSFHNTYAAEMIDGNEVIRNQGFDSTSKLAILNFDTLWKLNKKAAIHTGVDIALFGYPVTQAESMGEDMTMDKNQTGNDTFVDYADSIQGDVYLHWQPSQFFKWPVKHTKSNRDTDKPYDAMRLGIIARMGFVNREQIETLRSDSLLTRYGVGLTFRHHKTKAKNPESDNINETPIRWIELTYTQFEEWAGQRNEGRLVINAGFRINALGNKAIPFYAGLHGNVGKGPDDLQIIAGLVFKLDKLAQFLK